MNLNPDPEFDLEFDPEFDLEFDPEFDLEFDPHIPVIFAKCKPLNVITDNVIVWSMRSN
jgi:hypothetical protein